MKPSAKPIRGRPRKADGLREFRLTVRLTAKGRDALAELRKTSRGMVSAGQVIESLILQAWECEMKAKTRENQR